MSDNADVLDVLRAQFARVNTKLDQLSDEMRDVTVRLTLVETEVGHIHVGQAGIHSRLDRLDARVERIERRLDLVELPAG